MAGVGSALASGAGALTLTVTPAGIGSALADGTGSFSYSLEFSGEGITGIPADGAGSFGCGYTFAGVGTDLDSATGLFAYSVSFAGVGTSFADGVGSLSYGITLAGAGFALSPSQDAGDQSWSRPESKADLRALLPRGWRQSYFADGAGAVAYGIHFHGAGSVWQRRIVPTKPKVPILTADRYDERETLELIAVLAGIPIEAFAEA